MPSTVARELRLPDDGGMPSPAKSRRLAVGVGLDLAWGGPVGFRRDIAAGDSVSPRVARFLESHAGELSHFFVSWQPRGRGRLDAAEYHHGWDDLFARVSTPVRALHHTALNLGTTEPYDRGAIFELTNDLVSRYRFEWINEDLGLWSLGGRPLPYPMPPLFTKEGLRAAVRNVRQCQDALTVPVVVEFPGFSGDMSPTIGPMHPYAFLRAICEETGAPATLDVGHLLSYQWRLGRRGEALYDDLERLPLDHAFELHLAGSSVVDGHFVDAHHGRLLPSQLELCERLLGLCPNLRAVTFEDPRIEETGALEPASADSLAKLRAVTKLWQTA
ncbi:MAG: DUF692 family protein [Myxococcales bacterium]|nr:DUF692 family protein [Myxococcales bacterium]